MPNYPGKNKGTRRIVIWSKGKAKEWVIRGTKAQGDDFEARKRIELNANHHDTRAETKFEQICAEKYRPYAEANLAKSTWRARSHILVNLIAFFGAKPLSAFTVPDIDAYKTHRRRESKLGPSSMNTELLTLLYVLRWAEARGYRVKVPKIKLAKPPKPRPRIWTDEQVSKLLEITRSHDPWLLPMIIFLVNTGCRKGEAIAAEWDWIDFAKGIISIPATEVWKPKSGTAREVPLSDAVRAALSGERRSDRWVFANRDHGRFEYFPDSRFKELQTLAGVSGGAHTLRHYYASCFLRSKPDMFLLGKILGHTTSRITEIYSHLLPGHLEGAQNVVNIGPPTMAVLPDTVEAQRRKPA